MFTQPRVNFFDHYVEVVPTAYPIGNARGVRGQPGAEGARLILGSVEPGDLLPQHRLEGHPPHPQRQPLRSHGEHQDLRQNKTLEPSSIEKRS